MRTPPPEHAGLLGLSDGWSVGVFVMMSGRGKDSGVRPNVLTVGTVL